MVKITNVSGRNSLSMLAPTLFLNSVCLLGIFYGEATLASSAHHSSSASTVITDSAITLKIKSNLLSDEMTKRSSISVKTNNGVVKLSGEVNSDSEAIAAVQIAESAEGVKDVNATDLTVKGSSQPLTDSYITAKIKGLFVREKLLKDFNLSVMDISVETQNGVAYLSGRVDDSEQANKAISLAKSVSGVKNVISSITVDPNK